MSNEPQNNRSRRRGPGATQPLPLVPRQPQDHLGEVRPGRVLPPEQPEEPLPPLRARAYQPPTTPPPPADHATFDMQTVRIKTPVMSEVASTPAETPSSKAKVALKNTPGSLTPNGDLPTAPSLQVRKRRATWLGVVAFLLFAASAVITWQVSQMRSTSDSQAGDRTLGVVQLATPSASTTPTATTMTPAKSTSSHQAISSAPAASAPVPRPASSPAPSTLATTASSGESNKNDNPPRRSPPPRQVDDPPLGAPEF